MLHYFYRRVGSLSVRRDGAQSHQVNWKGFRRHNGTLKQIWSCDPRYRADEIATKFKRGRWLDIKRNLSVATGGKGKGYNLISFLVKMLVKNTCCHWCPGHHNVTDDSTVGNQCL